MGTTPEILKKIEKCYLPKLSKNFEECDHHREIEEWESNLNQNFTMLSNSLNEFNLKVCSTPSSVLSGLLLLYYQLQFESRWKKINTENCAKKLSCQFELLFDTSLVNLLKANKVFNSQEVFDQTMIALHQKLTPNDFKKYPAMIDAYCSIVSHIKEYDVVLNPISVLPLSLLLIEDYIEENRVKGLQQCSFILKCLTQEHFKNGNYYEVLYQILKKIILEKDLKVTELVLECLYDLINIIPTNHKVTITDNILADILHQTYAETNLYRKKAYFKFFNKVIHIHGIHCAKMKTFWEVIVENLDTCSNEAVAEILLLETVECLENWIKYCWCVWKYSSNKKCLSILMKILYITSKDGVIASRIQNIFITLCKLCSDDERKEIHNGIYLSVPEINSQNDQFIQTLKNIRNTIG